MESKLIKYGIAVWWLIASLVPVCGQTDSTSVYPFIVRDSPAKLFTIRQIDEDYLSAFRLASHAMNKSFSPTFNYISQAAAFLLAFGPATHEEAHRSVLTAKNIGSVSQPFILSNRGGYVDGVTDATLQQLRDNALPDYIRLYIAGSESDYMLTRREESLLAWGKEPFRNLCVEYWMRKAFLMQYYMLVFLKYDIDGDEEPNEMERDVVGNDIYGAARHLFRPHMAFHRYTRYRDLTDEEVHFVRKMGFRSFFNLVNLNLIGRSNIALTDGLSINAGMGHAMCPFGDFTDENLWLSVRKKWNLHLYLREFENRDKWFMGGGIALDDYFVSPRLAFAAALHGWNQPVNLDFGEHAARAGGAADVTCRYFFYTKPANGFRGFSVDAGINLKTFGYLPEEVELGRSVGLKFGLSLMLDR
ncbi:MAG: hypothetical protein Q8928_07790 [Bacteroidota bacterium]|nr:hypothetical protein [Bacteroidota bacterium]